MKICTKCGIKKPLIEGFHADKNKKDGRRCACKECVKAASRAWYRANPEKAIAASLSWYRANPDRARARNAQWYRDHPEEKRAKEAKWKRDHPETCRANDAKRRALKLACQGGHHTVADVKLLLETQEGLCIYCQASLDSGYHVDHIVPLSRGGSNGVENICLACPPCNLSKHSKLSGYEWCACDVAREESL